jgi:hypothetical protein
MTQRERAAILPRAAGLAMATVALAVLSGCPRAFDVDAAIAEIEERYSVAVVYEMGPDFLPEQWLRPPADGAAQPIGGPELARVVRRLPDWLAVYPSSVLRENLRAILLCGRLEFYGVLYAGTSSDSAVYLVNDARESGFTDEFLEKTFHHEFSSLLMYRHPFPTQAWTVANPAGFQYLADWDDVVNEVAARRSLEGSPELFREGLLAEYGRTNLENDVNTYAEVTFAEPRRMRQLVERYPAIRAKYDVLKSFYIGLDPQFEAWFQQIG